MYAKVFKRYRMDVNLLQRAFDVPQLPDGYYVEAWSRAALDAHATAHYLSFRNEMDAELFENFRTFRGARRLLEGISTHRGFCPDATWLIVYHPPTLYHPEFCATIQGLVDGAGNGAIQNVGVVPRHRGKGLGRALLHLALHGYQVHGIHFANLEVTAKNERALHLYLTEGFRVSQVVTKTGHCR